MAWLSLAVPANKTLSATVQQALRKLGQEMSTVSPLLYNPVQQVQSHSASPMSPVICPGTHLLNEAEPFE